MTRKGHFPRPGETDPYAYGSVWVMGEWSVGQWIVGVISFQKMYGLYGLKHYTVEISGDVTDQDEQPNNKER